MSTFVKCKGLRWVEVTVVQLRVSGGLERQDCLCFSQRYTEAQQAVKGFEWKDGEFVAATTKIEHKNRATRVRRRRRLLWLKDMAGQHCSSTQGVRVGWDCAFCMGNYPEIQDAIENPSILEYPPQLLCTNLCEEFMVKILGTYHSAWLKHKENSSLYSCFDLRIKIVPALSNHNLGMRWSDIQILLACNHFVLQGSFTFERSLFPERW